MMIQVRLIVEFEFETGKLARLEAFTLHVNAHGGSLESSVKVVKGMTLFLTNPGLGLRESCRVVDVHNSEDGLFAVAFEFDRPIPHFWPIAFPPKDWNLVPAND